MKGDLNKWEDGPCSWIRRLNFCSDGNIQIDLLFQQNLYENSKCVFIQVNKVILKCIQAYKGTQNSRNNIEKEN